MGFKKNLIFVFVAIMSSTVMAAFEDYDEDILREMLRTQVQCSEFFQAYTHNCSTQFDRGLKICEKTYEISRDTLEKNTRERRNIIAEDGYETCTLLEGCANTYDDEGTILSCVAEKASKASVTLTNMHYEAKTLQMEYKKSLEGINVDKLLCTMSCSQEMSDKSNTAMTEINLCLQSGIWTKQEIVSDEINSTEKPAVDIRPTSSVNTENQINVSAVPEAEETDYN